MESLIYFTIIIILVGGHLLNVLIELINTSYSKKAQLDEVVSDVYDSESYAKQQSYEQEKLNASLVESTFMVVITTAAFILGYFGLLNDTIAQNIENRVLQSLVFFGVLWFIGQILSIPFDYYDSFVIEERYGFNKSTRKLFFTDILKSALLTIILGGIILSLITWLYVSYPTLFWLPVLVFILILSLFSTILYTSIILPLFNKKSPLSDGELKDKLERLALNAGFSAKNIFVLDSSKRSTKGNAFFTGWGRNKRIYLYDTLVDKLSAEEIEAVLAHEIGHYKKRHIWINFAISLSVTGIFLFLFTKISSSDIFTPVFGSTSNGMPNFQLNILGFALIFGPVQSIIGLFTNFLSRKMEFSADNFANGFGLSNPLVSALKKLAAQNYSNLTPHPLYVIIHYSHPPLVQRIKALLSF
ncbi:MAG TPA: M48 family metallopeptidase [Tenuifilaceae bacterium]|nr:M48 family metallopeptidase [Tenuifilaceae bacterium]HPI44481.1 M48 family metallopeptidase [Tenuifilaceae bacterium]HPN21054.1 M48 family metallopeptidase [Tenuifilaceae bacterium]